MKSPEKSRTSYRLILVGGCRDTKDIERVETLKKLAEELEIKEYVEFKLNVSFDDLKKLMSEAEIGLHTMLDEHFGIGKHQDKTYNIWQSRKINAFCGALREV